MAPECTLSDNEEWQRKLRGGYSRHLSGENRDSPIALIDFKTPARNTFHVVRQLRVAAQRPRIPDIVLFVNGIPLVVIEAKCPLKSQHSRADRPDRPRRPEQPHLRRLRAAAHNVDDN